MYYKEKDEETLTRADENAKAGQFSLPLFEFL
jgi:hypothetical protein